MTDFFHPSEDKKGRYLLACCDKNRQNFTFANIVAILEFMIMYVKFLSHPLDYLLRPEVKTW